MADPFEVRMRFTKQLQHLNASVTASQKAAQYALRYKDMDEDLHSCIVEQLEQVYTPWKRPRNYFSYARMELTLTGEILSEPEHEYTSQYHVLH